MSSIPVTGVSTRSKRKRTAVKKRRAGSLVMARLTTFGIVACSTYIVSSLCGQVMVEKARQDSIRATDRALLARKVVGEINNRIDDMTGLNAVSEWAKAHNFYSPEEIAAASLPAAKRPASIGVPDAVPSGDSSPASLQDNENGK